jgi:ubiquinone/menaquinone biosynthesis C-methylase UbiE
MIIELKSENSAVHHDISRRWGSDIISIIPPAREQGAFWLELGCGDGRAQPLIEELGYQWVGIDISGSGNLIQADGHYLPFGSKTFNLVLTIAVFEDLYDPFLAAHELYRVLKPGGTVICTTAFLEHFHANSYFHMTHLGVERVFTRAGFRVTHLWPTCHFAESLLTFWIPTQLSVAHRLLSRSTRVAADSLMRVRTWGLRKYLSNRGYSTEAIEQRVQAEHLAWSGAIGFQACKD